MSTKEEFRAQAKQSVGALIDQLIDEGVVDCTAESLAIMRQGVERGVRQKDRFGKFYPIDRVRSVLGGSRAVAISRQAVNKQVQAKKILRVVTRDGVHLYPAFQFSGDKVEPTIAQIVNTLATGGMDEWSIVYWLTSPIPELEDHTAVEVVYAGGDLDHLLRLATSDAAHWVTRR